MGCFPTTWERWWQNIWPFQTAEPDERRTQEQRPLLSNERNNSDLSQAPPSNQTTLRAVPVETIRHIASTIDTRLSAVESPKASVLEESSGRAGERSTISGSSPLSYGPHYTPDPGTPHHTISLHSSNLEVQSNDIYGDDHAVSSDDELATLENKLWDARIEWPQNENRYFIPADQQKLLITADSIFSELSRVGNVPPRDELMALSHRIWKEASKLFAILVCMGNGMGKEISKFLQEGINDEDLPFVRSETKTKNPGVVSFKLRSHRRRDRPILCMAQWGRNNITAFGRDQWWMLAPIFEKSPEVKHYTFDDNCVLPFIEDHERYNEAGSGAFGTVWAVVIHPAHQFIFQSTTSKNEHPKIALKRLYSTKLADFELEVEMLKQFSNHRHPHLVKLLATFLLKGRFYLMFPFAPANLRDYWQRTPTPEFSYTTVKWTLAQCKGIASGLMAIHEYRSTLARPTGDGDTAPRQGDHLGENLKGLPMDSKKHIYGRHGDIKPENILWSEEDIEDEDGNYNEQGLLLIADFGLMDFHGKQTRSNVDPETINGSPSYEPPERRLRVKISRAYDIWSLGCVYLEFITWLVAGWAELSRFPEVRAKTSLSGINDDTFFTILESRSNSSTGAIIREPVTEWIKDLHEKPRCSQFIHDFLDLVSKDMLVVDASKRIHCGPLNERLEEMLKNAREDPRYLTEPKPRPERVRSDVARRMSQTGRQTAAKDSPPPSPTEGLALPKRNVPHNLDSVAGSSPPSRPMSPMLTFSQFE